MARVIDRQKTIELRKQGKTYSEIRKELGIPKSTLSDWLSKYPLTDEQIKLLERTKSKNKHLSIEKVRLTKQRKREARLNAVYEDQKNYWTFLNQRELELAGIFLYWGEGGKRLNGQICLNNTDPQVIKFTLFWLSNGLGVPKEKIRVNLHLYKDMEMQKEMLFWSQELGLPLSQFGKPYIKDSTRAGMDQKGFGHGTCGLYVSNVRLKEKIMMSIKAIADCYSEKIK